jgi:23S rRNA (guanosine2251-2'-O)-methyltransferase
MSDEPAAGAIGFVPAAILEGRVSIEASLAAGVRHMERILAVQPGDRRLGRLRALAADRGVPIVPVDSQEIVARVSGKSHGGVVAEVGERTYLDVTTLIAESGPRPLLVMLDGIEDPYNFGQAIRALYAAGVDGLVIRPRSWESAAAIVTRASAGTSELLPTAVAGDAAAAADACRSAGLQVVCAATGPGVVSLYAADLTGGTFLLVGGERRGVTRSFASTADLRVRIPYGRRGARALGAAAAAAVIAFEALRQRQAAGLDASDAAAEP